MRYMYLDILKLLAIFMVVIMHAFSSISNDINAPLYNILIRVDSLTTYGVVIFVMASGAMLLGKKNAIKEFYWKRFSRIVVPFLIWSVIYELNIIYNGGVDKNIIDILSDIAQDKVCYHLWFMYMIISIYLLTPVLRFLVDGMKQWYIIYIIWLILAIIELVMKVYGMKIPVEGCFLPVYVCYFITGYWIHNDNMRVHISGKVLGAIALTITLIILPESTFLISREYSNMVFLNHKDFFIIICSTIIFYCFYRKESFFRSYLAQHTYIHKYIMEISRLIFGIYLIHPLVLDKVYAYSCGGNPLNTVHPTLFMLVAGIVTFIISLLITAVCSKIPFIRTIV